MKQSLQLSETKRKFKVFYVVGKKMSGDKVTKKLRSNHFEPMFESLTGCELLERIDWSVLLPCTVTQHFWMNLILFQKTWKIGNWGLGSTKAHQPSSVSYGLLSHDGDGKSFSLKGKRVQYEKAFVQKLTHKASTTVFVIDKNFQWYHSVGIIL